MLPAIFFIAMAASNVIFCNALTETQCQFSPLPSSFKIGWEHDWKEAWGQDTKTEISIVLFHFATPTSYLELNLLSHIRARCAIKYNLSLSLSFPLAFECCKNFCIFLPKCQIEVPVNSGSVQFSMMQYQTIILCGMQL